MLREGSFAVLAKDNATWTLIIATVLCLVCSISVSSVSVFLRPEQNKNKALNRKKNILMAAGLYQEGVGVEKAFSSIKLHILDLNTGKYVEGLDPKTFDPIAAANNPEFSERVPKEKDIARIHKRSKYSLVYILETESGKMDGIILPVYGLGLWGKLYGFISLAEDLNTVRGFAFYEHKETPGLGAEVDNPRWKKLWIGKKIYNEKNEVKIEGYKG